MGVTCVCVLVARGVRLSLWGIGCGSQAHGYARTGGAASGCGCGRGLFLGCAYRHMTLLTLKGCMCCVSRGPVGKCA